jgi:hypothetical protein
MSDNKKKASAGPMQHVIPLGVAVLIPLLLGSSSPGLAGLPILYIASYRLRAPLFRNFYLLPVLCGLVHICERRGSTDGLVEAVLPIGVPIVLHYGLATLARRWGRYNRASIEGFCVSFSSFLDYKCYQQRSWPAFRENRPCL